MTAATCTRARRIAADHWRRRPSDRIRSARRCRSPARRTSTISPVTRWTSGRGQPDDLDADHRPARKQAVDKALLGVWNTTGLQPGGTACGCASSTVPECPGIAAADRDAQRTGDAHADAHLDADADADECAHDADARHYAVAGWSSTRHPDPRGSARCHADGGPTIDTCAASLGGNCRAAPANGITLRARTLCRLKRLLLDSLGFRRGSKASSRSCWRARRSFTTTNGRLRLKSTLVTGARWEVRAWQTR